MWHNLFTSYYVRVPHFYCTGDQRACHRASLTWFGGENPLQQPRRKEDSEPQNPGAPSQQPRTCFSCFDSFPWIHRKPVCESDTELKTLPSERTFRHLRANGAATGLVKRPYTPRSGVAVSSTQLDFGPEELRHLTCASSARAFDFCLVIFACWGVQVDRKLRGYHRRVPLLDET